MKLYNLFKLLKNKVIVFTAKEDNYQKINELIKLSLNLGFKIVIVNHQKLF